MEKQDAQKHKRSLLQQFSTNAKYALSAQNKNSVTSTDTGAHLASFVHTLQ